MNEKDLLNQMKNIRNNLEYVEAQLRSAQKQLDDCIYINKKTFQYQKFNNVYSKINGNVSTVKNYVIPSIQVRSFR